eukprot:scaffold4161_cov218-Pinguiococcus_pyrenoidosus.AAC.2
MRACCAQRRWEGWKEDGCMLRTDSQNRRIFLVLLRVKREKGRGKSTKVIHSSHYLGIVALSTSPLSHPTIQPLKNIHNARPKIQRNQGKGKWPT